MIQGSVPDATANQKSLEMLFDYTKFHIGLYLTLASAYIAVVSLKKARILFSKSGPYWYG